MSVLPRDLVVVHGDDTWTFLQSLVAQDVDGMADGDVRSSLLLNPRGRLDSMFRVIRHGDEAWLDVEAGWGPRLAASLGRYRIRVRAEIDDRSDGWGMVAVRGPDPPSRAGVVVPVTGGLDHLGVAAELDPTGGLTADEYERWRVATGVPRLGVDVDESTIAQEAFLERDSVSFTKGCFLGQEVVGRIDARGHVNKFLRIVELAGDDSPPRGAELVAGEPDSGEKVVGAITSVAGRHALGYVRREVEMPADVVVRWDAGETRAIARATPTT